MRHWPVLLAFTLAGCGGSDKNSDDTSIGDDGLDLTTLPSATTSTSPTPTTMTTTTPTTTSPTTTSPTTTATTTTTTTTTPTVTIPVPSCEAGEAWVSAGTYTLGSPPSELGRAADEAFREVELTRDMCMSTLEMTREAYAALTGEDPTIHPDCPDCPVTNVTWHMAAAATNLLSDAAGMAACYDCVGKGAAVQCTTPADPYACEGYRLPTEAEWEVACRAGSDTPFQGGDLVPGTEDSCEGPIVLDSGAALEDEAWVCSTDIGEPMAVGLLAPNPLGLYDMIGNAYEWVHDTYVEYPGDAVDPSGPIHGVGKVNRGGYYSGAPKVARAANRNGFSPDSSWDHIGFRVARTHRP